LNDFRRDLIERVFIILDNSNNGTVNITDFKRIYNAKRHPDVMQGKRSEEAVLMEFIETFDLHH
jgi:calcyphosin